ncbi:hypothetical protein H4R18_001250 [Coemansia javaensis]|uniref:Autophagy-related protein 101 n=1 Tax=Coemansia javaensis TaxID=2761396 RepID=A0A9W8HHM2_9FUNG|nr:hypothetical protein H4R18_001250 [Coemansia javaensis]
MNRKVFSLTLDLERGFVGPVVAAVLHTILFYRHFGNVSPRKHQALNTVLVDCPDVLAAVDARVDELVQGLAPAADSRAQISLSFTETKPRRAWFSKSEEEICWEEWIIAVQSRAARADHDPPRQLAAAEDQARRAMLRVIREMDRSKDHIPLIASATGSPFPFHIAVAPISGLWSSMIKRAIRPGAS